MLCPRYCCSSSAIKASQIVVVVVVLDGGDFSLCGVTFGEATTTTTCFLFALILSASFCLRDCSSFLAQLCSSFFAQLCSSFSLPKDEVMEFIFSAYFGCSPNALGLPRPRPSSMTK